jgi:FAS-associated factor 2
LDRAKQDLKFMLIYIHHVGDPEAERLCRETISSPAVAGFLEDNMVFWGETSKSAQGRSVATQLRRLGPAARSPFFAMVCLRDHQMQVICTVLSFWDRISPAPLCKPEIVIHDVAGVEARL